MDAAVLLINPKIDFNVAASIRACSIFGVDTLRWTGDRITPRSKIGARLPREERMKDYTGVDWRPISIGHAVDTLADQYTPVAVELRDAAEPLSDFVHPTKALYIFGPEDGSIPRGILTVSHRFVRIPTETRTPLNLAAAVNITLYDRYTKEQKT